MSDKVWDGRGDMLADARLTTVDGRMADDLRLQHIHFRVMAHVGRQNGRRGWLRVSQTELAARWDCHRNSVNKAFKELVAWGYLTQQTQQEAGESFCLYKVLLDGEATASAPPVKASKTGNQPDAQAGECTTESAPPSETPQGGSAHSTVHMCTVEEYTRAPWGSTPPSLYPRAHRQTPTDAEERTPLPHGARATGNRLDVDGLPKDAAALVQRLRDEGEPANVVDRFLLPILASRRFSAANKRAVAAELCALGRGLPAPALDAAARLVLAAGVATIKADRLRAALRAAKRGGAMVPIRRGTAQWRRWAEHFAAADPKQAALMDRYETWQVPAEWPPGVARPDSADAELPGTREAPAPGGRLADSVSAGASNTSAPGGRLPGGQSPGASKEGQAA